jgi:hypothetical protein
MITDVTGNQILQNAVDWNQQSGIDISMLAAGIYYYELIDATGRKATGKLSIQ